MKKLVFAVPALVGVLSAFAEGGSTQIVLDDSFATNLQGAFTTWAAAVSPVLMTIAGVFLGFWLIRFVLRLVKGVASAGK